MVKITRLAVRIFKYLKNWLIIWNQ